MYWHENKENTFNNNAAIKRSFYFEGIERFSVYICFKSYYLNTISIS